MIIPPSFNIEEMNFVYIYVYEINIYKPNSQLLLCIIIKKETAQFLISFVISI